MDPRHRNRGSHCILQPLHGNFWNNLEPFKIVYEYIVHVINLIFIIRIKKTGEDFLSL